MSEDRDPTTGDLQERNSGHLGNVRSNEMLKKRFTMVSGSYREGFRLRRSDIDSMIWSNNHRVIWNFSLKLYNTQDYTLVICDSSESPPGFTLLW